MFGVLVRFLLFYFLVVLLHMYRSVLVFGVWLKLVELRKSR